jgi:thiol-disulfide isomerase/thioredoxin
VSGPDTLRLGLAVAWLMVATVSGAASLRDVQAVPHLDERGRAGYQAFLAAPAPRAFVIAPGGAWAWRAEMPTSDVALEAALQDCQRHTEQRCVPYAVDDAVVFDARAWVRSWGPYATRSEAARAPVGVKRGQRFPDLILTDPAGKPRKLSDYRGKVVVVHFWGSWCPHCIKELPDLQRLYATLRNSNDIRFVLIGVREPHRLSQQWAQQQKLDLPLYDGGPSAEKEGSFRLAGGGSIRDRELARVFPSTHVLDKHGLVVFSQTGPVARWSELAPFLRDAAARSGR